MAKIGIDTGTTPNDGTGDSLVLAATKINSNFNEIYNYLGNGSVLTSVAGTWRSTSVGIHTIKNVGIGTTNPTSKLTVLGDANISGVVTASSFRGNSTSSNYASSAGIATYSSSAGIATYASISGISTNSSYSTTSGIATYASLSGIATFANSAGIVTYSSRSGLSTYASSAGIATYSSTSGLSTNVIGGIASVTTLTANTLQVGSNRLAIFSGAANYVGIGSTLPDEKLVVLGGNAKVGLDTSHGLILTSQNGTKYKLFVQNNGQLSTVQVL